MRVKTTPKAELEKAIMLKIRWGLILLHVAPNSFHPSIEQRLGQNLKRLEERLDLHHPSEWFNHMFCQSMAYYAGYCWAASFADGHWSVAVLDSLPEHVQEVRV